MAKDLRAYVLMSFEDWDAAVAQPLVDGALDRHGLSRKEFGFSFGPAIRKILRRGRIANDEEFYIARAYAEEREDDGANALFEMIDLYDTRG